MLQTIENKKYSYPYDTYEECTYENLFLECHIYSKKKKDL